MASERMTAEETARQVVYDWSRRLRGGRPLHERIAFALTKARRQGAEEMQQRCAETSSRAAAEHWHAHRIAEQTKAGDSNVYLHYGRAQGCEIAAAAIRALGPAAQEDKANAG